jgi:hypothetical protein
MSQLSIAAASAADVEPEKDVFAILGFTASPLYRYAQPPRVYLRDGVTVHACFVLFCFVLFCFVLFCFVLFCFVLFCFVLFCFVLFCFVLFCFVLFCFVVCFSLYLFVYFFLTNLSLIAYVFSM